MVFQGRVVDPRASFHLGTTGIWATYKDLTGGTVGVSEILAQIDGEIAQLQKARTVLGGGAARAPRKAAAAPAAKKSVVKKKKKKRNLSPEGRKRIVEAVKRRWAEQKKAAAAK
jgi:pyruvate/2-oxoglutarate dehydrogenase complex dihydrolipoamide acyltransferase (E2) component